MKKIKVIAPALIAIAAAGSVVAGSTYALFTSEAKTNVAITSGKVDVTAAVEGDIVKSHKEANASGEYVDADGLWGGDAVLDEATQTITITNMMPMDKVEFDVKITNNSSVKIKYRTVVKGVEDDGLFAGLSVKIGEDTFSGGIVRSDWASYGVGEGGQTVHVAIELPKDADNAYQGKSCKISYSVEAVQGNAATPRDTVTATAEVSKNAENKTEAEVTIASEEKRDGASLVSAVIPDGTAISDTADSLTLTVENATTPSNISVVSTNKTETIEISLDGLASDNDKPIVVTFYADKNLDNFVLYHSGVAMTDAGSEDAVDEDGEYYYTVSTGMVKMAVTSFSPFTYVSHKGTPVKTEEELKAAIALGGSVSLVNDIGLSAPIDIVCDSTIYGNGYALKANAGYSATRIINLNSNTEDVTFVMNGLTVSDSETGLERGLTIGANKGKVKVEINDSSLFADHYALNVAANVSDVEVVAKNSSFTGYAAFQTFVENSKATFQNCTLTGRNKWSGSSDDFALLVVNENADGSVINCKNCKIIATEEGTAKEYFASIRAASTVAFDGCTFEKNGNAITADDMSDGSYFEADDGVDYELTIQ